MISQSNNFNPNQITDTQKLIDAILLKKTDEAVKTVERLLNEKGSQISFNIRFDPHKLPKISINENGFNVLATAVFAGRVEVVELLFKHASLTNNRYSGGTLLHLAVLSNNPEVIQYLIALDQQLPPEQRCIDIVDNENQTPLDLAISKNCGQAIITSLQKAGVMQTEKLDQMIFINNYNFLIKELNQKFNFNLKSLDNEGICDGLSKAFAKYTNDQQSEEFKFFMHFMISQNEASLKSLVDNCYSTESSTLGKTSYTLKELIQFVTNINHHQIKQLDSKFKNSIGAHWNTSQVIDCHISELTTALRECEVIKKDDNKSIQFKFILTCTHRMVLMLTANEIYLYNPNVGILPCQNEEALTGFLSRLIASNQIKSQAAGLIIDNISFENENPEFDDLISIFKNNINNYEEYPGLKTIIQDYERGSISQQDTAFLLLENLFTTKYHQNDEVLKNKLQKYISQHPLKNYINPQEVNSIINSDGESLLFVCCRNGNLQAIKNLIESGANLNLQNKDGNTALHYAVIDNKINIIELLIQHGANVNIKNKQDHTPLLDAVLNNNIDMVQLLIKAGGDINTNTGKVNLLDIARIRKFHKIENFIKIRLSNNEVMSEAGINKENESIALKLSKLFNKYANPPLFSNRTATNLALANELSITFKAHETWSAAECQQHLQTIINQEAKKTFNQSGTFVQFLSTAYQLIDDDQYQQSVKNKLSK